MLYFNRTALNLRLGKKKNEIVYPLVPSWWIAPDDSNRRNCVLLIGLFASIHVLLAEMPHVGLILAIYTRNSRSAVSLMDFSGITDVYYFRHSSCHVIFSGLKRTSCGKMGYIKDAKVRTYHQFSFDQLPFT